MIAPMQGGLPAGPDRWADALARPWDVAVVGAGPAGALAARQVALAGLSVVLIDKAPFPRDKVCGCCLNAAAQSMLAAVGLVGLPERLGAVPVVALGLAAGRARARLPLRSMAVSRAAFDLGLVHEATAAGVLFLPRTVATVDAAGRLGLRPAGGGEASLLDARVVLVADGLAGSALTGRPDLAPRIAANGRIGAAAILPATTPGYARGSIHMTVGPGGYVGAVRLEDHRLNVAAALDPGFVRAALGPARAIATLLAAAGMPAIPGLADARFHATPMLTRARPTVESDRVLILGDAAAYVEPFTGEGIAWALASAVAIVPAVIHNCGVNSRGSAAPLATRSWRAAHRRRIAPRQRLCRAVAWTLRRPRLATVAVRALALLPSAAGPALRRVALPYARAEAPS